jgi:hypothetical protein
VRSRTAAILAAVVMAVTGSSAFAVAATSAHHEARAQVTSNAVQPGCYGYRSALDSGAVHYACTAILSPARYQDGHSICRLGRYSQTIDFAVCADGYVFTYPSTGVPLPKDRSHAGCYAYLTPLDGGFGSDSGHPRHYACTATTLAGHTGCRSGRFDSRLTYLVCGDGYVTTSPRIGVKVNG